MTVLSVNVNKIAVLRNSRGEGVPDVVDAARVAIEAGCGGITVHPRPDLRHVHPDDVRALAGLTRNRVELNVEGNPFAGARGPYPGLLSLVDAVRPQQVTLVPDADGQITSDHGFDLVRDEARLRPVIDALRQLGCRVSLFVDQDVQQVELAAALGADRVEIYTGPFAEAHARGDAAACLASCALTASRATACGLGVNAGHDLNQGNLGSFLAAVPAVKEVSIGHALIADAIYAGLDPTVRAYLAIIASA
jgi:pyridoxine 5-phosphate synthase